jgi:hypothetical protein
MAKMKVKNPPMIKRIDNQQVNKIIASTIQEKRLKNFHNLLIKLDIKNNKFKNKIIKYYPKNKLT